MIRKTGKRLKRLTTGTSVLRRQAIKRSQILSKYREESIKSTVLKSGDSVKGLLFKASDIRRDHKLLIASVPKSQKNWFLRFLDRVKDTYSNTETELMLKLKINLAYNLAMRPVEVNYEF